MSHVLRKNWVGWLRSIRLVRCCTRTDRQSHRWRMSSEREHCRDHFVENKSEIEVDHNMLEDESHVLDLRDRWFGVVRPNYNGQWRIEGGHQTLSHWEEYWILSRWDRYHTAKHKSALFERENTSSETTKDSRVAYEPSRMRSESSMNPHSFETYYARTGNTNKMAQHRWLSLIEEDRIITIETDNYLERTTTAMLVNWFHSNEPVLCDRKIWQQGSCLGLRNDRRTRSCWCNRSTREKKNTCLDRTHPPDDVHSSGRYDRRLFHCKQVDVCHPNARRHVSLVCWIQLLDWTARVVQVHRRKHRRTIRVSAVLNCE